MSHGEEVARQHAFYADREHAHLRPRGDDRYAAKLAGELARELGLGPQHRVLEVGAGFGRFTFDLLEHCGELVALDLSERALAELARARDVRGIPAARCRTLVADVYDLPTDALGGPVDFVVGFFLLHHLPDPDAAIARLAPLVAGPGRGMAFVEPNRRNPLFLLQVACCADMTWQEEKGMFRLSQRSVEQAYGRSGFERVQTRSFGFFPPQLHPFAWARRAEAWLEHRRWLSTMLPMLLLSGRRAG